MHRRALRATVGGVEVDVPVGTWTAGQFLRYNATGGPGGTPIIDSAAGGGGGGGDVTGPGSSVDNHVARFDLTTGKIIQDGTNVTIDDSSNMSGVGTLNGRTIANWVDGPASAVSGRVASFNGVTGKLIQDAGFLAADVVTQAAVSVPSFGVALYPSTTGRSITGDAAVISPAAGQLQANRFIGPATGLRETGGPTDLTMGAVAAGTALTRSGTTIVGSAAAIDAHAARHLPAGADTMFPGTWVANDDARWTGAAFAPQANGATEMGALFSSAAVTTLVAVTSLSVSLPRAGTYIVDGMIDVAVAASAVISYGLNVSANLTRMNIGYHNGCSATTYAGGVQSANLAVGGAGVAGGTHGTATTRFPTTFSGIVVVSGAATLQVLIARSTSTVTVAANSSYIRASQA